MWILLYNFKNLKLKLQNTKWDRVLICQKTLINGNFISQKFKSIFQKLK